jgi:hypothetical protein
MTAPWLLLCASAMAGQWLPETPLELQPELPLVIEQSGASRLLLQVEPADADLEAWVGAMRVPLRAGPGDTWLVPSEDVARQLELRSDSTLILRWWRETSVGEAQAWDLYERRLYAWGRDGGALPAAPAAIPAHGVEWEARRRAMDAAGELDPDLLLLAAVLELEDTRARSWPDHGERREALGRITRGETATVAVRGPGVLTLRTRALMEDQSYRRYGLWIHRDGQPLGEHQLFTTEDEEGAPGWGWPRSTTLVVPPGEHRVEYRLDSDDDLAVVEVEAVVEHQRGSLQRFLITFPHARSLEERGTLGTVGAMEVAHLTGQGDVVQLAELLLDGPADELARARLIEHLDAPAEATRVLFEAPFTPMTALAMARRWRDRRDIDPALLLEVADLLPADPALLADIADALPQGFVRPRGRAIRALAGFQSPGTDPSRWTQLAPEGSRGRIRVPGTGGGLPRVMLSDGQVATAVLPEPAIEGRFPVLRMEASSTVRYRVDGALREGQGELEEALAPGSHKVEVEEGRLILLDAALIEGGDPVRDKAVGGLPNRWLIPDQGAPAEVEVMVFGEGGRLVLSTDDGQVFELETAASPEGGPGLTRAVLPVGPRAGELRVEGPSGVMVGVALRRNSVEQHPAVPGPWPDPLEYFWDASRELIDQPDPLERADLRLKRAASYHVLGLVVSAQREARAVAAMPLAASEQRAVGMALYRNTVPPVHTAEFPGPVTVDAALAWAQVPHQQANSCEELVAIATELLPPVSWPVHEQASTCFLERGAVVEAWIQAEHAGPLGRVARLRAADAGDWHLITRVDQDGGTFRRRTQRRAPELADGLVAYLRELSLGVPWARNSYTVVRDEKRDVLSLDGQGTLQLQLICRDESFAVAPGPCTPTLVLDGQEQQLELAESSLGTFNFELGPGHHVVELGPLPEHGQALAVRAALNGQLLPPQAEFTVHRLGYSGLDATVAGPGLIRLRLHEHGPVTVQLEGRSLQVEDELVIPIRTVGPVRVHVDGPPESTITLSRLEVCGTREEEDGPMPRSLDHNLPLPKATWATDMWMREVAAPAQPLREPMDRGGTLGGWVEAGDDATGVRDTTQSYRFLGAGAGWYQRLDGRDHWLSVYADGRASIDGPAGALIAGQWVHTPGQHQLRVEAELAGSGGAGHGSSRATWRYWQALGPWWSVQPFAHLHAGWWSDTPGQAVDPNAWSAYAAQHFFGLDLGVHADYRPMRDLRLRFYTELDGNPNMSPDGVHVGLRTDALVQEMTWLELAPQLTVRFADANRQAGYLRPSMRAGLAHSWYSSRRTRWEVGGRANWYPLEGTVEGTVGVSLQYSRGRGLRDQSPFDQVFGTALDLPLESR